MKITRKGWGIAYISPEVVELLRDYVMSGKGEQFGFYRPDWVPNYATEEFLYRAGYKEQITEIRTRKRIPEGKKPGLDSLTPTQRSRMVTLMNDRGYTELEALKRIQERPEDVEVEEN